MGEMGLVLAAAAICAVRTARGERALLALGLVLAAGALLHRSALGLLPGAALAVALGVRARAGSALREPASWIGAAVALAAIGLTLPRALRMFAHADLTVHLAPASVQAEGGVLRSLLDGGRWLDVLNVSAMLSPLALAALVVAIALGWRRLGGREAAVLAAIALPFLGLLAFVHPAQGPVRDWDTLAEAGLALSLLSAWVVGLALHPARGITWIGVAASLGCAAPATQWLAHQSDVDRGLVRVAALLREPPARSEAERGRVWDYLGVRNYQLRRWDAATAAFAHAAETQPSPRILLQWALAEAERGNLNGSAAVFRRAIARDPANPYLRLGLANVAMRSGNLAEARAALEDVVRRHPDNQQVRLRLAEIVHLQSQQDSLAASGRSR